MSYGYDSSRSMGYIYHGYLGIAKSIWYIAPLIVTIGVINEWWAAGLLLVIFSAIDAGVDIFAILMTLFYAGPSQTTMPAGQATWVSKWSLLKHTLSDQWHFSASLVMNAWFILGFYPFYFVNAPITQLTLARFIGYHFLYLSITLVKSIIIFFTGFTTIDCDACGPFTVKPCVDCEPPMDVESGNSDVNGGANNNGNNAMGSQLPSSAISAANRGGKVIFKSRGNR